MFDTMDFLTEKEINILKGEIEAKQYALDAEKFNFEKKLKGDMGEKMMQELASPHKKQVRNGLFYKLSLWLQKKKELNKYVKYDNAERTSILNSNQKRRGD